MFCFVRISPGARVIMACRDMEKCEKARQEIYKQSFNKKVECRKLDLSSIASIRAFARKTIEGIYDRYNN